MGRDFEVTDSLAAAVPWTWEVYTVDLQIDKGDNLPAFVSLCIITANNASCKTVTRSQ
jgi:hypothetical protein